MTPIPIVCHFVIGLDYANDISFMSKCVCDTRISINCTQRKKYYVFPETTYTKICRLLGYSLGSVNVVGFIVVKSSNKNLSVNSAALRRNIGNIAHNIERNAVAILLRNIPRFKASLMQPMNQCNEK